MKINYVYAYHVYHYDEDGHLNEAYGVTSADSYAGAMANIAQYYGDAAIENVYVESIEESGSCLELSPEEIKRLKEESVYYYE